MKKPFLLTLLSLALATFAFADDDGHQSYLSYDDGGTIVKSGDDGREIDAQRNLPTYPGDEVITSRRGRAEVRLSDGNIVGIDRTTAIRFRAILDSYEGDDEATVAELRYGKVAVYRTDIGRDDVRLDTASASYVADNESVYSVETDSNGRDRVTVFDGTVEVRTRERTSRLRSGESATVDQRGLYDLVGDQRNSSDDFERWFLKRADRFENYNSRYVDRRLGYWTDDLDDYGRWVHVTGIGWSWRPYVSAGWRPYYNGYWHHGRGGALVWVSYDPWAWGTFHYGRWAYDPVFGWFWVPGSGYSPAWVYWSYGPSYVGWAPAGWWDCYRPYYSWAYDPYRNYGVRTHGFGFYGRVAVNEFDLRPWTFVNSNTLVSHRVDRAALTADAVKDRMFRAKDGFASVTGGPTRFTREELRDPAEAIRRRGLDGSSTGRESGAGAGDDMTAFMRRDAQLSGTVRDRIVRARGAAPSTPASGSSTTRRAGIGSPAQPGSGTVDSRRPGTTDGGRILGRGADRGEQPAVTVPRAGETTPSSRDWRGRIAGRDGETPRVTTPATGTPSTGETPRASSGRDAWRDRVRDRDSAGGSVDRGASDAPRRIIDGTGGARVVPRDRTPVNPGNVDRGSSRSSGSSSRDRSAGRGSSGGGSVDRGGRSSGGSSGGSVDRGGSRSSGGNSGGGSSARQSPPPQRSSPPPARDNGGGGGSRGDGGRIQRDQ